MLSTISHCLGSKNYVNLVVSSKQETPVWLTADEAAEVRVIPCEHILEFHSGLTIVHNSIVGGERLFGRLHLSSMVQIQMSSSLGSASKSHLK